MKGPASRARPSHRRDTMWIRMHRALATTLSILAIVVADPLRAAPDRMVGLRIIVVATAAEANDLVERARSGESFAELAKKHSVHVTASRGGYLGKIAVSDLAEDIRNALPALKPGDVAVVRRPSGEYYVLKLLSEAETDLVEAEVRKAKTESAAGSAEKRVGYAIDLDNEGVRLVRSGQSVEAELRHRKALAIFESELGPDHKDVGLCLTNLATALQAQGKYPEAERASRRSLAIFERVFSFDSLDLAQALVELGNILRMQNKFGEAEPLLRRALVIRTDKLGADSKPVASARNSLAIVYNGLGRFTEAESLLRLVLPVWDNPADLPFALHNLAEACRGQAKFTEADALYRRAIALKEKAGSSPESSSSLALSLHGLAQSLWEEGKPAEAEPFARRAAELREKALGPSHPDFAGSLTLLGLTQGDLGRYEEGIAANRRAMGIVEQRLGSNHPYVAFNLMNMGALYLAQRKASDAEPLLRQGIAILESASPGDRDAKGKMVVGLIYLGGTCLLKQDYPAAEEFLRRARTASKDLPDHVPASLLDNMDQVGLSYQEGHGLKQDDREAFAWYLLAATRGYAQAQNHLGWMYMEGKGLPRDYGQALSWLRKAAETGGSSAALANLANLYAKGLGVKRDAVQAYAWLLLAPEATREVRNGMAELERDLTPLEMSEARQRATDWEVQHRKH